MKKSTETYNFDEIIVLTNEELTSNWSRLATLVRAYEKCTWDEAKAKALKMLGNDTAIAYIESVRKHPNGKPAEEPLKVEEPAKLPRAASSVYHQNFKRLLKLAPGLIEKLETTNFSKGEDLYGKSKVTGYQDWSLQVLQKIGENFYIAIAHYREQNGDLIPDPDMQLRLNLKNEMVEALEFQNAVIYKKVYDDSYKRKKVDLREQKNQNTFLSSWLLNLKRYGHKIKWRERKPDSSDSDLTIEYEWPSNTITPAPQPKQPEVEITKIESRSEKISEESRKRIVQIIVQTGKIPLMLAEKKAHELEEKGTVIEYLLDLIDDMRKSIAVNLLKSNYSKLLSVIPGLLKWFETPQSLIGLSSKKKDMPAYAFGHAADIDADTSQFAIYEKRPEANGTLMIAVNRKQRTANVEVLSDGFFDQHNYMHQAGMLLEGDTVYINHIFTAWLDHLVKQQYVVEYTNEAGTGTPTDAQELPPEQSREEWLNEYKENAKKIPHFEPGQVQLTDRHIKAGVTQETIDWINEHKEGMVLKPRKGPMINNTKSKEMDKAIHAKKPGMRISATGQIYYEGRSNRSDRRNTGL